MSQMYILPGEPISMTRLRIGRSSKIWDASKQTEFNARNTLDNQHRPNNHIDYAIVLSVSFFFKPVRRLFNNTRALTGPHLNNPDLIDLINFIETMGTGVLWIHPRLITSINARKLYHDDPHTEIEIIRAL